jgi:hypothetical protein
MDFFPSKADSDIWICEKKGVYEYIAVYMDNLAIAAKNPEAIVNALKGKYDLKLKGVGPIEFHLGCDFFRDPDQTLCFGPRRYVDRMVKTYERMFGKKPKEVSSPLVKNNHPEMDTSELVTEAGITQYQSMIGASQWPISLGCFNVHTAIMTMSHLCVTPRVGHLEQMKQVYGYLQKFRDAAIPK